MYVIFTSSALPLKARHACILLINEVVSASGRTLKTKRDLQLYLLWFDAMDKFKSDYYKYFGGIITTCV
jgi:hypothetical protein